MSVKKLDLWVIKKTKQFGSNKGSGFADATALRRCSMLDDKYRYSARKDIERFYCNSGRFKTVSGSVETDC